MSEQGKMLAALGLTATEAAHYYDGPDGVDLLKILDRLASAGLGGKAEAWDEGFDVGEMYGHGGYPVSEDHIWAKTANPYK